MPIFGWYRKVYRLVRSKLIIPVMRSKHSAEHTARGVMVGIMCGMTPTVGIQMVIVLAIWIIARKLFGWDFSLVNGIAWSWVTNVFTMVPIYYVFYVTGQLMMGQFAELSGYDSFERVWVVLLTSEGGSWDRIVAWFLALIADWGLPLVIGCLPWSIMSGWLAYRISFNFVVRHREGRTMRRKHKQRRAEEAAPT